VSKASSETDGGLTRSEREEELEGISGEISIGVMIPVWENELKGCIIKRLGSTPLDKSFSELFDESIQWCRGGVQ
jgi:hypothetical protein